MKLGPSPPRPPGPSAVDLVREDVDEAAEADRELTACRLQALRDDVARRPPITFKPEPKPKPKRRLA
jgi:hypothetical protein